MPSRHSLNPKSRIMSRILSRSTSDEVLPPVGESEHAAIAQPRPRRCSASATSSGPRPFLRSALSTSTRSTMTTPTKPSMSSDSSNSAPSNKSANGAVSELIASSASAGSPTSSCTIRSRRLQPAVRSPGRRASKTVRRATARSRRRPRAVTRRRTPRGKPSGRKHPRRSLPRQKSARCSVEARPGAGKVRTAAVVQHLPTTLGWPQATPTTARPCGEESLEFVGGPALEGLRTLPRSDPAWTVRPIAAVRRKASALASQ